VSSATVTNGTNVLLVTTPRTLGNNYCITLRNVKDIAEAGNVLNTVTLTLAQDVDLITWSSVWQYNTNNLDGTGWEQPGFNDSAWSMGPGLLGFESTVGTIAALNGLGAPTNTIILFDEVNNAIYTNLPTAYFRITFDFPGDPGGIAMVLEHIVDDGAVFHLNGVEVGRFNIVDNPVVYATLAPAAAAEGVVRQLTLSGVKSGQNRLAVEVHQNSLTSSDLLFGAQLQVRVPVFSPPVSIDYDIGSDRVTLRWTGHPTWQLFQADVPEGPYTAVPGNPASPYVAPRPPAQKYYRLSQNCP